MIIGLVGRAQHGKTTAANAIMKCAAKAGLTAKTYDIGSLVLAYCIGAGLIPDKTRSELSREELAVLVRVGKEKRVANPLHWVDQIRFAVVADKPDVAVIPNVRFQTEVDFIKEFGGVTIRIRTLNQNGSEYISPDRDANDQSETELYYINADYHITTKRGQGELVRRQSAVLFEFIREQQNA